MCKDLTLKVLHYGPLLNADGLEVVFYPDWYPHEESIGVALQESGLHFPIVHAEKSIGRLFGTGKLADRREALQRLAQNCRFAREIGAFSIVLHLWSLPEADDTIENNLAALAECHRTAETYAVELTIETVLCRRTDPLTHIHQAIVQDERCCITLDTEFLAHHNQLDEALSVDWLWHHDRVRHLHVKDYDGRMVGPDHKRRYLHPGEGNIDFDWLFTSLKERRFHGSLTLEASAIDNNGQVDLPRINHSLAFLHQACKQMSGNNGGGISLPNKI